MKQQLYYTIEVRDKNGKLLKRMRRKSRSLVRQWIDFHYWLAGIVDRTATDTGGISRTLDRDLGFSICFRLAGGEAQSVLGIVIGTGTTAVTISDYALATQIAHGVGAGQMYHYADFLGAPSVSGSECSFTITRVIGNQSGALITVKEIGVYTSAQDTSPAARYFCVIRDVLAASVDVLDGGAITVVYTIKVVV